MIKAIGAATAILLSATIGVQAQTHQEHTRGEEPASPQMAHQMMMGGMMGQGMMESGMMEMMGGGMGMMATGGPSPAMLLRLRDELQLTEDQVRSLEGLREEMRSRMKDRMPEMMAAHRAAATALEASEPDVDAYRRGLERLSASMVDAHVTMAEAAIAAGRLLTPGQGQTLDQLRATMMHGGMHQMPDHRPKKDRPGHGH